MVNVLWRGTVLYDKHESNGRVETGNQSFNGCRDVDVETLLAEAADRIIGRMEGSTSVYQRSGGPKQE